MTVPDPAEKKGGTKYEPITVRNTVGSIISRYLEDKHYVKILESPTFRDLQEVLKTKMKTLKEKGVGVVRFRL